MSHYKYDRLSAQDASFLVFETPNAPMHVAGTQIFEAGPLRKADGGIDIARIREATRAVLHLVPRYCQKLAWIPYFDHPVWVDDRDFNLDYHIRHTALPRPGGKAQLRRLVSRVIGQRLDRSRPLWETWVVEGLEGDRFALISKVHHCMIDGQSGVDLSNILLSSNAETIGLDEDTPPFIPRPAPRPQELVFDELIRRTSIPIRTAGSIRSVMAEEGVYRSIATRARALSEMFSWLFNARSDTPLNGSLSPHRRFDWLVTSLDETKAVRRAFDCSVNDVVLAVVSGAIREFLLRRHVRPESIRFHVSAPVNVRTDEDQGRFGNRVSSWIVELPIDAADPLQRIRRITAQTRQLKESRAALGVGMMMAATEFAPRLLLPIVARASSLPINMVVTNVPGPQVPLYMFGARLEAAYPLVPLIEGTGLGIALISYDNKLCWGVNADYAMVPDITAVCAGIERAFTELKTLASGAQGSIAILTQPSARAAKTS
jgi:diacylglycerol O-acyltransferase